MKAEPLPDLSSDLEPLEVVTEPLPLTLVDPFTIARGTETRRENLLVRVRGLGAEGLGEASPNRRYGEDARSAAAAIARAVPAIARLRPEPATMGRALDGAFAGKDLSARAGLEMALYDWMARASGLAVHQLLWLEPPKRIETSFTIAIAEPAEMARRAQAAAAFRILKVKVGSPAGLRGLEAVRDARPDARLMADGNEGWDADTALGFIPRLVALGVEWLEQPLPASASAGMACLRGRGIRIMADEALVTAADLESLAGAVDGVNVKVAKVGGMAPAAKLLGRARELGLVTMLGCMIESSLGIGSALELSSLADMADLDGHLLIADDPFEGLTTDAGWLMRAQGPGLGARRR